MNLRSRVLTRERLSAPHFLAYQWVLDNLPPARGKLLDFGSRNSVLPMLLADAGWRVTALDRVEIKEEQRAVAERWGVTRAWDCCWFDQPPHVELPFRHGTFAAATAVWAVQHNFPIEAQEKIVANLAKLLDANGVLIVVSSYDNAVTREDHARKDPQIVLSRKDHERLWRASGLELDIWQTFRYEHGTVEGDWCDPKDANAICCKLGKL